ncbi:MAG TPA: BlaI/MecI/CopY family transcriptional regulator [Blastocatellia bacterium]|nr:BlaI/MecI/CopY family transcriptional regulator [Blastocatellia bacterium]
MPRKPSEVFTDKEIEIMRIVWQLKEATIKDIQQQLPGEPHYNSVLTIVRVLERKGHLVHRAEGKTFFYRAAESKEKARSKVLRHLIDEVFGGSAASVVMNLAQAGDLTKEDLDEIRRKVAKMDKEKRDVSSK